VSGGNADTADVAVIADNDGGCGRRAGVPGVQQLSTIFAAFVFFLSSIE